MLLSTAVAVPLLVVLLAFLWFLLRAQLAEKKSPQRPAPRTHNPTPRTRDIHGRVAVNTVPAVSAINITPGMPVHTESSPNFASVYAESTSDSLCYQPLANYLSVGTMESNSRGNNLGDAVQALISSTKSIQFDVKDIPGINGAMEKELHDLGYTSVEQIARWGRADVRAVSATLGVDQQILEDEWVAGARLILSIR